jgi:short/branched chain acyl-CoA dehydrogenase
MGGVSYCIRYVLIVQVFANVDPSKGYKGITCFVISKDMGVQIAKKEKKVGNHRRTLCMY